MSVQTNNTDHKQVQGTDQQTAAMATQLQLWYYKFIIIRERWAKGQIKNNHLYLLAIL